MRSAARRKRIKLQDERAATLIGTLYTEGVLMTPEFSLLTGIMRARNRIAHGYRDEELAPQDLTALEQLGIRLAA